MDASERVCVCVAHAHGHPHSEAWASAPHSGDFSKVTWFSKTQLEDVFNNGSMRRNGPSQTCLQWAIPLYSARKLEKN